MPASSQGRRESIVSIVDKYVDWKSKQPVKPWKSTGVGGEGGIRTHFSSRIRRGVLTEAGGITAVELRWLAIGAVE